jgi:transposase
VIGLDEWAWRKGHRYGTIICDLEQHRPLDLLPSRKAAEVIAWLKRYPSIEMISRDRSGGYAEAARLGAPQAIQIADKWHLHKNLREALEVLLTRHLTAHRKSQAKAKKPKEAITADKHASRLSVRQEQVVQLHRTERMARYEQVIALSKQGLSHEAIAQQMGMGHSTIQRWRASGTFPDRKRREQSSQLDPYLPYALKRWSEGCHNMARIYEEIKTQGYKGSYDIVRAHLTPLRQSKSPTPLPKSPAVTSVELSLQVSSRQAAWLLIREMEKLTKEERETLTTLRQLHPEIELAYGFVQEFAKMIRTRTGEKLDRWLEAVEKSPLTDLQSFVTGVYQDKAAVQAGLTQPWSQGQTEGQITRLKLIKRQGYGRASFDLLRHRVLQAA